MRDKRFIAEHRGGLLTKQHHRELMLWACSCVEHILTIAGDIPDRLIINAILVGRQWVEGNATVGEARKASEEVHRLAKYSSDSVISAIARAAGHAVATAHMADHAPGAAMYALKSLKTAGKEISEERTWQNSLLPPGIRNLVLETRAVKEKSMRLL